MPVGSYPKGASWVGALDMAGNAMEWVADWWSIDLVCVAKTAPRRPNEIREVRVWDDGISGREPRRRGC